MEGIITHKSGKPHSISSPDGTFRVQCEYEPHERTAAWEVLRIVSNSDNRLLLKLPKYFFSQTIEFPEPGIAEIPLEGRFGQQHRLRVNVNKLTFLLDADQTEQPLELLPGRLLEVEPKEPLTDQPLKRPSMKWLQLGVAILSPILAAAAMGMYLYGKTAKIRMMGVMWAICFGFIAAIAISLLARRLRRRRW